MAMDKLNHYSITNPASIYDEEAMTSLELAGRTAAKVNEAVNEFNRLETETNQHLAEQDQEITNRLKNQDTKITNSITHIQNTLVPTEVTQEVNRHISAGDFDSAIDEYAGNLTNRLENLIAHTPEGSTTLDLEIVDGRLGNGDISYPSIGEAIRGQTTEIKPTRLDLSAGEYRKDEPEKHTRIVTGAYKHVVGYEIQETAEQNSNYYTFKVKPGSVYVYTCGIDISPMGIANMLVPVYSKNTSVSCLSEDDLENWPTLTDSTNFVYRFKIPLTCNQLFIRDVSLATPGTKPKLWEIVTKSPIGWIKIRTQDIQPETITPDKLYTRSDKGYSFPVNYTKVLGKYFACSGKQYVTLDDNSRAQNIIEGLKPGDHLRIQLSEKPANLGNYFLFTKGYPSGGAGVISTTQYSDYISVYDTVTEMVYDVIIPDGCDTLTVTTARGTDVEHWKIVEKISLDWLKVTKENLETNVIPESNTMAHVIGKLDFGSISNNDYIRFYGDSITLGATSGSTTTENGYAKLLSAGLGVGYSNKSKSGYTLLNMITDIANDAENQKTYFIALGTNDFGSGINLGEYGDTYDPMNVSFYGGLNYICTAMKEKNPNSNVIFLTPIPRFDSVNNSHTLDEYRRAIFEVATAFGYSVIDGSKLGMPTKNTAWGAAIMPDGLHPSEAGHKMLSKAILGVLK